MVGSFPYSQLAFTGEAQRSHWLLVRVALKLIAAAALSCSMGCAAASGSVEDTQADATEADPVAAAEPSRSALRDGAYATPQTFGGFCEEGLGVYLSAAGDTAELTLYVVWPAKSATFHRPALYLTTQEGDHSKTEVAEFDDVTLQAGESRYFRRQADGKLMEVFADFAE